MRWLEYSIMCRENAKYGDIKERYLWIDRSFRTLMKHYENERKCENCNGKWCHDKYDTQVLAEMRGYGEIRLDCIKNNHKHWEANYEN